MDVFIGRRLTIRRLCREHDAYTDGHVFPVQHVRHPLLILQLILRTFLYPARTCSIQSQKHPHTEVPDLWIHWQLMYRFLKDTICPFKIHVCAFKSNCVAYFCWNTTFHCLNLWYTTVFFPESLSASTQKPCTNIHLFVFHIEICVKGSQFTSDVLETCCQFI